MTRDSHDFVVDCLGPRRTRSLKSHGQEGRLVLWSERADTSLPVATAEMATPVLPASLKALRSTPFVVDQFIPEFWQRSIHPNLGVLGTIRYRLKLSTLSSYAGLRLRLKWDTDTNFTKVVEEKFRLLNAMLILQNVPTNELTEAVTEPLARDLPLSSSKIKANTPLFRVIRMLEKPQVMQHRIFVVPTPDKEQQFRFSQVTMRLLTEQSPVRNEHSFPVEPIPLASRKVYLPAARPKDGRLYFYDPKSLDRTYRPVSERFSSFPLLQPNRGTFGNSGQVVDRNKEKKLYSVENFVVMERRLDEPVTPWRIHLF